MTKTLVTMMAVILLLTACDVGGKDSLLERWPYWLMLAGFLVLLWDWRRRRSAVLWREGEAPAQLVDKDDPAMLAAAEEARRTLATVLERLSQLQAEGADVSIKARVASGDTAEQIWLDEPRYEEGRVHGVLANTPVELSGWTEGDPFSVATEEILDWMVVRDDGRLIGGYSLFVLRDKLSGRDRQEFEAAVGVVMPETPHSLDG